MPKKNKKTILRKPISRKPKKDKNVNVTINIDNSKKTTARRTAIKPSNMQPFVNFPSYQPTRIQQLEPLKKYNNGDLTKTDDMYQKQFKAYLETTDKSVKDIIEKFDDTLKKNTAPQKKEESKPGASNVYADTKGETFLEEPIELKKRNITHTKDDSDLKVGFSGWDRKNDFQGNPLTSVEAETFRINNLFEAEPLTVKSFVKGLSKAERTEGKTEIIKTEKEETIIEKYNKYLVAYKKVYGENDNNYIDINSDKGKKHNWGNAIYYLEKKLSKEKEQNLRLIEK